MSEIKDLEQAFFILEHGSSEGVSKYLKAIKMIKEQCVQVVRCKDCVHYNVPCPLRGGSQFFCAYGERKGK